MNVLICAHNYQEGPGIFGEILGKTTIPIQELAFHIDPFAKATTDFSHLLIMGGPMNVDQVEQYPFLQYERELILDCMHKNKPILGICLGAQLIARALGARVFKNPIPEIGWFPIELTQGGKTDPLLQDFPNDPTFFQWHEDTFDIPTEALHLAESKFCRNQAFRYGSNIYGFQFHLEVTSSIVESWMVGQDQCEKVRNQTPTVINQSNLLAINFFEAWLKLK